MIQQNQPVKQMLLLECEKLSRKNVYCQIRGELERKIAIRKKNVRLDEFFPQHVLPSEEAIECG